MYVLFSKESKNIRKKKFTHGIDVLGSRQGAWLMCRANIPNRFGVKGYAGGHNWCTKTIDFKEDKNVGRAALSFLKLLNINKKIEARPEIYLTDKEFKKAERIWSEQNIKKIIVAPGGGFPEKCWGEKNFTELTKNLNRKNKYKIIIIGTKDDEKKIKINTEENILNLCGKLTLRESAALVSKSDLVISNSSLCMHLAGAFKIPSLILLGDWYESAKLHHKQWGYPECKVYGKEISLNIKNILSTEKALCELNKMIVKI